MMHDAHADPATKSPVSEPIGGERPSAAGRNGDRHRLLARRRSLRGDVGMPSSSAQSASRSQHKPGGTGG
jgi:hypothetical protein